jgi:Protein of unknown function (DUF2911)
MKHALVCAGLLIAATTLLAQQTPPTPPKSPAATESAKFGHKAITITYSSPRVNGRAGSIFTKDGVIGKNPNYPVWRAGANAATKLHTDAELTVGKVKVPKGDYSLFVDIVDPDNWVLIINNQTGMSPFAYDSGQNLGRVAMTMAKPKAPIENLKYTIKNLGGAKAKLSLEWENHIASVPFTVR